MGTASSSQNRVSSAGPQRGKLSDSDVESDVVRPKSSSPAYSRLTKTNNAGAKKKPALQMTEVSPLSSNTLEKNNSSNADAIPDNDLKKIIKDYELKLAKAESQRLDLLEQISTLKQSNALSSKPHPVLPPLGNQDHALAQATPSDTPKDQNVSKMEKDLETARKEISSVRQKLKKRIKTLTGQLHEAKQEASINQMEMKAIIAQQKEEIEELKSKKVFAQASGAIGGQDNDSGHSNLIVELSNQLSEQADQIAVLQGELLVKNQTVHELEEKLSKHPQPLVITADPSVASVDRLPSGRGMRTHKNPSHVGPNRSSKRGPNSHSQTSEAGAKPKIFTPVLERQSTALSDSDSDWEMESVPSKIHSAPVGSRVKSAMSVNSSVTKDDVCSIHGTDDSILNVTANPDMFGEDDDDTFGDGMGTYSRRSKSLKKSALKSHLERKKNAKQTNSLIGPSLAFAPKTHEPPSDTSCEPTPRCGVDRTNLPVYSSLHTVKTISH